MMDRRQTEARARHVGQRPLWIASAPFPPAHPNPDADDCNGKLGDRKRVEVRLGPAKDIEYPALQHPQPGGDAAGEPVRVAVSPESAAVPKVTPIDRAPEKAAPVESPVTVEPREQEVAMSGEMRKFAEDFTRSFLGAVAGTFQEMHGLLAEDRGRIAAAIEESGGQIAALRQQIEAHSRLLAEVQSAMQNLYSRQEGLEKRLEVQAGAIRTIHAAVQEREDRFNKLLLTLQPPTAPPNASGLPDNL